MLAALTKIVDKKAQLRKAEIKKSKRKLKKALYEKKAKLNKALVQKVVISPVGEIVAKKIVDKKALRDIVNKKAPLQTIKIKHSMFAVEKKMQPRTASNTLLINIEIASAGEYSSFDLKCSLLEEAYLQSSLYSKIDEYHGLPMHAPRFYEPGKKTSCWRRCPTTRSRIPTTRSRYYPLRAHAYLNKWTRTLLS